MNRLIPLQPATRIMLWLSALALLLLLALTRAAAQPDPKTSSSIAPAAGSHAQDVTPHPGMMLLGQVTVGQSAPDFELNDSQGRPVRLNSLRGGWVLLVFADRKDSIATLGHLEPTLRQHAIRLVGVCNEKIQTLQRFASLSGSTMLMLADVTGEVSALYGLHDQLSARTLPGYVLIDPRGVVQIALLGRTLPMEPLAQLVIEIVDRS